jgi:DNA repair photolyase
MEDQEKPYLKGRGAQINPANRFESLIRDEIPIVDPDISSATRFLDTHAKTILNKIDSPDIGMAWSMNPYQGCEHGCVYCYARNTHPYWGYSAGLDFESVIMVKRNAPALLREKLRLKSWEPLPIMLAGNTDCYQPVEKTLGITRELLEVLWEFRHPVGLITKNSLILRDIDLLEKMAEQDLVKVSLSINSLDETLRQKLEPRTATYAKRLDTVRALSHQGIPVNVMVAPIIPGLNEHEIFNVVEAAAEAGARSAHHIVVRLNGDVRTIFEDWLVANFPDRASKVIHKISSTHGGKTNDSRFHTRMRGEGQIAQIIADQMKLAKRKYLSGRSMPDYNTALYAQYRDRQLSLF